LRAGPSPSPLPHGTLLTDLRQFTMRRAADRG
jgi:hypothetical protein